MKEQDYAQATELNEITVYTADNCYIAEDLKKETLASDLPPLVVPVIMLYSPIKHWLLEGEVSPPVPEVQILMNYVV